MITAPTPTRPNYLRIALQSGLAAALMLTSAIAGGTVLGIGFSWFVEQGKR